MIVEDQSPHRRHADIIIVEQYFYLTPNISLVNTHLSRCRVGLLGIRVAWAQLLDGEFGNPLAHVNRCGEVGSLNYTCHEAGSKRITV
jgi:hypothetical protein